MKPLHIFLEEVKRKSENNFGNSIGDKDTRSSEMKSKFQSEQRTKIVFQMQKRKGKIPNFQKNSLAFRLRTVGKYGASWKVEWGFYGAFNRVQKDNTKKRGRSREFLF